MKHERITSPKAKRSAPSTRITTGKHKPATKLKAPRVKTSRPKR